jgi:hypothetical protein
MTAQRTASGITGTNRRTRAGRLACGAEPLTLWAVVLGCILVYFGVRGLTERNAADAVTHGRDVLAFENKLGIDLESRVQAVVIRHEWITDAANWVYIWGHWPVIALTLIILHRRNRPNYLLLRDAMIVSGAIGLVVFVTFPVAPPRLIAGGFVDTVTERSHTYRVLQPPALVNKYAALPSLHAGWNLLVGITVWRASHHAVLRALAVLSPALMMLAVVATANHYVVDPLAGALVVLVGLGVVLALRRHRGERPATRSRGRVAPEAGDEVEIVDDEGAHSVADQATGAADVAHAPGEDDLLLRERGDATRRQQPLVHRHTVVPRTATKQPQHEQLEAVASGADQPRVRPGE